ncbi:MAG: hypothetical protein WDM71_09220 [Ferruginibacter sp.]
MLYIDSSKGKLDTIHVLIPLEKNTFDTLQKNQLANENIKQDSVSNIDSTSISSVTEKPDSLKAQKFINMDVTMASANHIDTTKQAVAAIIKDSATEKPLSIDSSTINNNNGALQMINSDCKNSASQEDFLKLRKKNGWRKSRRQYDIRC